MAREISIQELHDSTSEAIVDLAKGERLTLTDNSRPLADLIPHVAQPNPWLPASELRRLVGETGADPGLLEDLTDIRADEIEGF